MWELLANVQQLAVGSQLKQRNSYVEPINETIFNVDYIGEHYFTIRSIKQNNVDIDVDDQIIFNYKIGIIPFVEFMIELSN
jgi:TnpA family transposase